MEKAHVAQPQARDKEHMLDNYEGGGNAELLGTQGCQGKQGANTKELEL